MVKKIFLGTEYRHYIITRFNLKIGFVKPKFSISTGEGYLKQRFALFEKYTYPTLKSQSVSDYIWLVEFDVDTPQIYKDKIKCFQQEMPNFQPIFLEDANHENATLNQIFKESGAGTIITTRIDNDDAIRYDFVEHVQQHVIERGSGYYVFGFQNGIQYDDAIGLASHYVFPLNHFTTMVAPRKENMATILSYNHTEIAKHLDFENIITEKPMWIEVVHETNVSNRMHSKVSAIIRDKNEFTLFPCQLDCSKKKYYQYVIHSIFLAPMNGFRLLKGYGVKMFIKKAWNKIIYGHG